MTSDSFFTIACMSMLAMFFGSVLAFAGYRFFMFLLPVLGFFFGFGLGAQTMQAIFGEGFLATTTSWIVGFFTALLFAVLSYLFYFAAVGLLAGALGYSLGAGLMLAIGFDMGFLVWLVGFIVGVALAVAVLVLNVQKWLIIAATAILGAGVIVGAFVYLFGGQPAARLAENPVEFIISTSPFWLIIFITVAVLGGAAQFQTSKLWEPEDYNRWEDSYSDTTPPSTMSPAVAPIEPMTPAPEPPLPNDPTRP